MKMEHEHMPCGTMEESSLYRIGMFAAMNHVTVKALLSRIAELTRQIAVVDGYLSGQKARLASPVLIKTIPATTVACKPGWPPTTRCLTGCRKWAR